MKFIADVNIPQSVIEELRIRKHDVLDSKQKLLFAPDTSLVEIARKERRIILTKDKDFITLTQYPKYQVPTIVIRLKNQTPKNMLEHVMELLKNQRENILNFSLTIVKEDEAKSYPFRIS